MKAVIRNSNVLIEDFIRTQVIRRGLDERTAKAYRLDLEHFYIWLDQNDISDSASDKEGWEEKVEAYLSYLSGEKGLRTSTIFRKYRVFGYYLSYLAHQGYIQKGRPLKRMKPAEEELHSDNPLTKQEVDAFFQAMDREYEGLDSDFRRRVCLRDRIMMELLFYHGIEISELLRMETSDYDRKTGVLRIRRKKEKDCSIYLFSRILREQMEQWLAEHDYFEHIEEYQGRMFLSKLGKPLSMKMVINVFEKYRVMAGIEKECTPKDLKGSMAGYAKDVVRGMWAE
ncbi:MAG: tyrosine-type recombinase/integrase [Lachnospiraceae bacterium]|nr:tyrosine-type recombinase/integrase [Lachnospiraceae bacterium]